MRRVGSNGAWRGFHVTQLRIQAQRHRPWRDVNRRLSWKCLHRCMSRLGLCNCSVQQSLLLNGKVQLCCRRLRPHQCCYCRLLANLDALHLRPSGNLRQPQVPRPPTSRVVRASLLSAPPSRGCRLQVGPRLLMAPHHLFPFTRVSLLRLRVGRVHRALRTVATPSPPLLPPPSHLVTCKPPPHSEWVFSS